MDKKILEKKDILGQTEEIKTSNDFMITEEAINLPLKHNGTITRIFCLGCGFYAEISEKIAKELGGKLKIGEITTWNNYYFETDRCILCNESYQGTILRKKK